MSLLDHVLEHIRKDLEVTELYVVFTECVRILDVAGFEMEGHKVPKGHGRVVTEAVQVGKAPKWRLKKKYVRCGKPNCSCNKGKLHGPYLVKVQRGQSTKRPREIYVGKNTGRSRRRGT